MAVHPTGLGKGLDALIRESGPSRDAAGIQNVSLKDISPNPNQPRRAFDKTALEELAASIRSQGLLQPLLVRPLGPGKPGKYEIVAGERRWRASQMAGLSEVPVLVRSFTEQDVLAAALIENLQREDLNPMEEALGLQKLKEEFGLSQDELAKKIGKSRSAVANSLRLLALTQEAQKHVAEGTLSAGHARTLLSLPDAKTQAELLSIIVKHAISVREAEGQVALWKEKGRFEHLPFSAEQANLASGKEAQPDPPEHAQNGPTAAPGPKGKGGASQRPQSATLLDAQNTLGKLLKMPVRITGREDKGKISFAFSSRAELETLLELLSTAVLEGANLQALSGKQQDSLSAQEHAALESPQRQALAGADAQALSHRNSAALPLGTTPENTAGDTVDKKNAE